GGRSRARVAAGYERLVIKLDAVEEARGITRDYVARIPVMVKDFGDQFIDIEKVWAGDLDRVIPWCLDGHLGNRARDVLRRHRLEQRVRHTHRIAVRARLCDRADPLEEQAGADDRVRDGRAFNHVFLDQLRPEV